MKKAISLDERIIFALDCPSMEEALRLLDELGGHVSFFKVGLELFLASGWEVVEEISHRGFKVMLDLKFYDIPETVKRAVKKVSERDIFFTTIHGNGPIIQAANETKGKVKLLAVTVLTSFDNEDIKRMGLSCSVEELVIDRAKRAIGLGCDGVVASAREASLLRKRLGEDFYIVTPGIRPKGLGVASKDDQRRVMTPFDAIRNGADYLVIGRPIRDAKDPIQVVNEIKDEMEKALA